MLGPVPGGNLPSLLNRLFVASSTHHSEAEADDDDDDDDRLWHVLTLEMSI
jgi:hypothetical protein